MLHAVQKLLLDALLSDDPEQMLRDSIAQASDLSAEERDWLRRIDGAGLRLTSLMVQKLRFERLTRADPELGRLFQEEPERFMELFQAYTAAVTPTVYFPGQEAALYRQWLTEHASTTGAG